METTLSSSGLDIEKWERDIYGFLKKPRSFKGLPSGGETSSLVSPLSFWLSEEASSSVGSCDKRDSCTGRAPSGIPSICDDVTVVSMVSGAFLMLIPRLLPVR